MIKYDGVSIETIAPVKIEDVRVYPVQINSVSRPRAIYPGSDFVRNRNGTRTVDITFALLTDDLLRRQDYITALNMWAKTDAEYMLELPVRNDAYLEAVCTKKPEPSFRQWWESKLRFTFTCFDNPFWTSNQEEYANCGSSFTVDGNEPPLMQITRTLASSTSNQSYSDGTHTMTFSSIPAGNLVIDLNHQTAAVNGSSIMANYQASGSFIVPRVGAQTISGNGLISYRERWS